MILPMYKVESYIGRCLESCINQEGLEIGSDYEIICVNDGSTDSSGSILDNYAFKDSRIKVLHRDNAGYGAAMNAGLAVASGEYIGIVESDDCILPEMYETLYSTASKNNLDLVKSDAFYWLEKASYCEKIHNKWLNDYYDRILDGVDHWKYFDFFMNIWTGIYRREFLEQNNIGFHETPGASYQDNGFWIQTLTFCKRAMWLSQAFYLYRQDNPMASVKSQSKMLAMTKEYEYIARIMKERQDTQGLEYCNYFRMFRHRGTFLRIADEYKREFCDQIIQDYGTFNEILSRNPYLQRWYQEICSNPDEVCNKMIRIKRQVYDELEKASGLIIYGAGTRGHIVFKGLYNEGFYDKICCFAVSENHAERKIGNREILLIQDAVEKYPNALVIIAVIRGTGMYDQMLGRLGELGISTHMDGSDIEENFYIL